MLPRHYPNTIVYTYAVLINKKASLKTVEQGFLLA
jgi:hypothetical protein